ncbi:MAG TPA: hypothetical protein ENJ51_04535 [Leucothrix mucor]|uniref:Uncharacterized protein n=1 Tax=Leucothrix mucor TaxID=45248 RepID=A0A7V2WUF2_LEUMU|nr:hypothetical protein [Leucothrix mucor]
MKLPTQQQQLTIITLALRGAVWLVWILFIALDGIGNSKTLLAAMYWLPWVGIGLFFAWCLDGFIRDDKALHVFLLVFPFYVVANFVQV